MTVFHLLVSSRDLVATQVSLEQLKVVTLVRALPDSMVKTATQTSTSVLLSPAVTLLLAFALTVLPTIRVHVLLVGLEPTV
eukprot:SAG31_NODE_2888_length_4948_cov_2.055475_8_plen_81_part_00